MKRGEWIDLIKRELFQKGFSKRGNIWKLAARKNAEMYAEQQMLDAYRVFHIHGLTNFHLIH